MSTGYARDGPNGRNAGMSEQPPDDLLIRAMVVYLDQTLSTERVLREILAKAGFNDPNLSVEECVTALVQAHLRLTATA